MLLAAVDNVAGEAWLHQGGSGRCRQDSAAARQAIARITSGVDILSFDSMSLLTRIFLYQVAGAGQKPATAFSGVRHKTGRIARFVAQTRNGFARLAVPIDLGPPDRMQAIDIATSDSARVCDGSEMKAGIQTQHQRFVCQACYPARSMAYPRVGQNWPAQVGQNSIALPIVPSLSPQVRCRAVPETIARQSNRFSLETARLRGYQMSSRSVGAAARFGERLDYPQVLDGLLARRARDSVLAALRRQEAPKPAQLFMP